MIPADVRFAKPCVRSTAPAPRECHDHRTFRDAAPEPCPCPGPGGGRGCPDVRRTTRGGEPSAARMSRSPHRSQTPGGRVLVPTRRLHRRLLLAALRTHARLARLPAAAGHRRHVVGVLAQAGGLGGGRHPSRNGHHDGSRPRLCRVTRSRQRLGV